jgi:hypothetical protein
MSFLKNTLKDDKHSDFLVDNIMCGNESITYPQFLQIFGHEPLPSAGVGLEKRPTTASLGRTRQSITASDTYKNYMFAQVPNCSQFEPLKGAVAIHPMVRDCFMWQPLSRFGSHVLICCRHWSLLLVCSLSERGVLRLRDTIMGFIHDLT